MSPTGPAVMSPPSGGDVARPMTFQRRGSHDFGEVRLLSGGEGFEPGFPRWLIPLAEVGEFNAVIRPIEPECLQRCSLYSACRTFSRMRM